MTTLQASNPKAVLERYTQLSVSEKLVFLWMTYQRVGQTIVPDAPSQAYSEVGHRFHQTFQQLGADSQEQAMRDILANRPTRFAGQYESLPSNCRLAFWFELAQTLSAKVNPPEVNPSQVSEAVQAALTELENLERDQQLEMLHAIFTA
ncbi:MAG: orange carotenoid protein N-terminal domain-containing protein [Cyanobacteria bacterium P01_A01_bin.114]